MALTGSRLFIGPTSVTAGSVTAPRPSTSVNLTNTVAPEEVKPTSPVLNKAGLPGAPSPAFMPRTAAASSVWPAAFKTSGGKLLLAAAAGLAVWWFMRKRGK